MLNRLVIIVFLLALGCSKPAEDNHTSIATNYINEVLDLMEHHSVHRLTINWTDFRAAVIQRAASAHTISDTYPAIVYAIGLLGDNHTIYISAGGTYYYNSSLQCFAAASPDITPPANIGYVRVPGFLGDATSSQANILIQQLQDKIKSQDSPSLLGWIVDLRANTGGNMWPMLAGIGPILGNGPCGYFVYPDGTHDVVAYQNGSSMLNGITRSKISTPYTLLDETKKVAVLIDGETASSGEAITIAFVGKPNTRLFGVTSTCGLSTANAPYQLSDKAYLYLTDAVDADRNLNKFGGPVPPDVIDTKGQSAVVTDAINWVTQ